MIKYYLGVYGHLAIAKAIKIDKEQAEVNIHMHYSEFTAALPAGSKGTIYLSSWENTWLEFDTEGKKKIIRKKFE